MNSEELANIDPHPGRSSSSGGAGVAAGPPPWGASAQQYDWVVTPRYMRWLGKPIFRRWAPGFSHASSLEYGKWVYTDWPGPENTEPNKYEPQPRQRGKK